MLDTYLECFNKYVCSYVWIGPVNGLTCVTSFVLSLLLYSYAYDSGSDEISRSRFIG